MEKWSAWRQGGWMMAHNPQNIMGGGVVGAPPQDQQGGGGGGGVGAGGDVDELDEDAQVRLEAGWGRAAGAEGQAASQAGLEVEV